MKYFLFDNYLAKLWSTYFKYVFSKLFQSKRLLKYDTYMES